MIEAGKTYRLRGGLTARIGFTDKKGPRPISGLIDRGEIEEHQTWHLDGRVCDGTTLSHYDIIMPEPERDTRWMNWYNGASWSGSYSTADHFVTRELADKYAGTFRTHVLEIKTESGEPVEVKVHKVTK